MIISDINYISDVSGEVVGGSKRGRRGGGKDVDIDVNVAIIKQTAVAKAYSKYDDAKAYATNNAVVYF